MFRKEWQQIKKDNYIFNLEEAQAYFPIIGFILLSALIPMVILDKSTLATWLFGTWGTLLISFRFLHESIQKKASLFFYLLILLSLSLVLSCVLQNNINWNWTETTGLICLFILISFLDWLVFLGMLILSLSIATVSTLYTQPFYSFSSPSNIELLMNSSIPALCLILIWRYKAKLVIKKDESMLENFSDEELSRQTKIRITELETALVSKTEFLNNISHEIRTPIQGFTTLSEGLVIHWNSFSEEKKLDLANQVSNNARRLASLVTNLLDFSKFTADKMIMDFQLFSLNATINEIIEECKELYLNGKKIEFKFNFCKNDDINADRNRIDQVLRNLFVNAIKFSPDNSVINASLKNDKLDGLDALHFTITDTGIGIPNTEIASIFDPFIQSSRTRSKGGTGLGLSISKKIIDAHDGKIWAENNKKSGASFHFIIPVNQTKEEVFNNKQSVTRILMVDDEEICLSSMELLLTNTPFTLIKVNSGNKALEYLKNNYETVDLILLDLMMPDIYGLNILETIKRNSTLRNIPVILQSGTSDKSEIQKAYSIGIFSYISKPYKRNIILAEINKAINYYTSKNQHNLSA